MSDTIQRFFMDEELQTEKKKELSKDVENLMQLFELLKVEDKVLVKRLIREFNVF